MTNLVSNFEYLLLLSFFLLRPSFEIWDTFKVFLLYLILMLAELNQNKHSKFDANFTIQWPVEIT